MIRFFGYTAVRAATGALGLIVALLLVPQAALAQAQPRGTPSGTAVLTDLASTTPVTTARQVDQTQGIAAELEGRPADDRRSRGPVRGLFPGVLIAIDPAQQYDETYSRHDIVELLGVDPNFDWAKDIRFEHDIWALDFAFKPVRMVEVDIPQADGRLRRQLVWYMVFRVLNFGEQPVERFAPVFVLESDMADAQGNPKQYVDRVIPVANGPIAEREHFPYGLLNTVEISGEIPTSERPADGADGAAATVGAFNEVWGVATWRDVDPRTDRFSVYVSGLTNAYRWEDTPEGRTFAFKTLKLNFWRPGDDLDEHEREISFGWPDAIDYEWVYR